MERGRGPGCTRGEQKARTLTSSALIFYSVKSICTKKQSKKKKYPLLIENLFSPSLKYSRMDAKHLFC